ncbi:MAG: hypothetical protein DWP97_07180 [Calditrichaeota bacterium]|nr:MAG: hypothetical protein DWP97_07180 [Calditrichota bacterium]
MKIKQLLSICFLSLSVVAFELTWTRIFSAEFFYTFAFLILSLAILGLGLGALAVRLFPQLYKEEIIGGYMTLSGLSAVIFPPLVMHLDLKFSQLFADYAMMGKLLIVVILLSLTFFFAGMALAVLFRKYSMDINRLYMYDLIGAGAGVFLAIWLMNTFGTPFAVFLAAVPMFAGAVLMQPKFLKIFPLIFLAGILFMSSEANDLLEKERKERLPVIYKHWDAMAKVKLYDYGPEAKGINIDNIANTPVYGFDGDYDVPDSMREWSINVSYLINQFDSCRFLSLGSGGGADVLQALVEGATEVHAVEVNPHINYMMEFGDSSGYIPQWDVKIDTIFLDTLSPDSLRHDSLEYDSTLNVNPDFTTINNFSGNIYSDPRVMVVTEDARAYIRRFENKFDMIYSLSSNTWAALSSGAFALAENYIFTTEAYEDYWKAMSDSGFMMMEHQFYMPRLVSEVIDALKNQGVENYRDHFAVYNLPAMRRNMILISKRPLTDSLRYYAFGELTYEKFDQIHLLYPPANDSLKGNLINRIVEDGWKAHADTMSIDISPATDNRPFVAQMGLWKNINKESLDKLLPYEFYGFPLGKLIIVIILGVVLIVVIPLNFIPYVRSGEKLKILPWLYFFAIGVGFMATEIILMQKYTLFIGPSVYAVASILFVLLLASGVGSRFAERFSSVTPFVVILFWILLDVVLFNKIIYLCEDFSLALRIFITLVLVAPLGFFMGMPFPKATKYVGELIDWGFAVNGAASVIGSTLILLVAFSFGFKISMMVAGMFYLLALLLILKNKSWR